MFLAIIIVNQFWPKAETENQVVSSEDTGSLDKVSGISKHSTEWYAEYLQTFFSLDFNAFENAKSIENDKLITFGILKEIVKQNNQFNEDSNGNTILSASNVSQNVKDYFDVAIKNDSIESFVEYDSNENVYRVIPTGLEPMYMTVISSVKNVSANKVELEIEFYEYSYDNSLKRDNKIIKKMKLVLNSQDDKMIISSYKKI